MGTGDGWKRGARKMIAVAALAAGVLVAVAIAGRPAGASQVSFTAPPKGLLNDLAALDVKLAEKIKSEKTNRSDSDPRKIVDGVLGDVSDLVDAYFDVSGIPTIHGVSPATVFARVRCIDVNLSELYGKAQEEQGHAVHSPLAYSDHQEARDAYLCASLLADRLGAEPGVGGEAVQLAHDIRALMGEMELGPKAGHYVKGLLEKVKTEISAIQVAKRRLVETWFHQPIYGVPLSDSVLELDCVTSKLYQAYGIAQQARQHTFAGSARDLVVPLMEAAKRCKEHLEAEFRGVPAGGQQTTSTSNTGTSTSTSTTTGTQSTSTTTTTTGGQGTPPPVSHFCQTPPLPCAAWVQGSDLYETGLAINDELTNFNMALPSGTVITSVTGGCAFSGNDISCPAVNGYESIIITTKQQLQPIAHATLTYYYAQSPPATYSISLTNCSQTSCP